MNEKLAARSAFGMVAGGILGIVLDPMFGSSGLAMLLSAGFGLVISGVIATILSDGSSRSS